MAVGNETSVTKHRKQMHHKQNKTYNLNTQQTLENTPPQTTEENRTETYALKLTQSQMATEREQKAICKEPHTNQWINVQTESKQVKQTRHDK